MALSPSRAPLRYWLEGLTYGKGANSAWLQSWKDRFHGKPMLVIGNGPSLNQTPLHEFTHVPAIGMNKIDMLYPRTTWRPVCVMCVNDVVVRQNWEQWLAMKIPTLLSWKTRWHVPQKHRKEFDYFLSLNSFDSRRICGAALAPPTRSPTVRCNWHIIAARTR